MAKKHWVAVRDVALTNLVIWLVVLLPSDGVRGGTMLLIWSAIWLVVVLPLTIGIAMTSRYESEQWGILRSKQSLFVNRHLSGWTGQAG